MAKKRKASGRQSVQGAASAADVGPSRMRISTYEDVAGSDDEFHISRDKMLLDEGPEAKRRRKWQEQGMR